MIYEENISPDDKKTTKDIIYGLEDGDKDPETKIMIFDMNIIEKVIWILVITFFILSGNYIFTIFGGNVKHSLSNDKEFKEKSMRY